MHANLWKNTVLHSVLLEIIGRYHSLFKPGFGPLNKAMEHKNQQYLRVRTIHATTQEISKEVGEGNNAKAKAHQHRTITTFFSSITHATS